MNNNLVTQTQRPALTEEEYIGVLSLKRDKDNDSIGFQKLEVNQHGMSAFIM